MVTQSTIVHPVNPTPNKIRLFSNTRLVLPYFLAIKSQNPSAGGGERRSVPTVVSGPTIRE